MFWTAFLLLAKGTLCLVTNNKIHMVRHPGLDGRKMTTSIIRSSTGEETEPLSFASCAKICAHMTECVSFFYNSDTNQCQFHDVVFMTDDGAAVQPGVRYYYKMKDGNGWCPVVKGFQLLTEDGPCVKFHTERKTWYEANQICVSYSPYSRLVVLDNQEKNHLVRAAGIAINDQFTFSVAIGLSDLGQNTYKWIDGKDLDFTDWGTFDASEAGQENCVFLLRDQGWKWYRSICTNRRHFICETVMDTQTYRKMMYILS